MQNIKLLKHYVNCADKYTMELTKYTIFKADILYIEWIFGCNYG